MARTKKGYMRPPMKWPGGKGRLVGELSRHLPRSRRLVEPFAGSAVVSLNNTYEAYWINDINPDLIGLYRIVQGEGRVFVDYARGLFVPENNREERYYELRAEFNATEDPVRKAALFLYLGRYGYNGLIRYSAAGRFNVPFGRYKRPYFPESELLHLYELAQRAVFTCEPFEHVFGGVVDGDVVYADPPYVPLSDTAYFTDYAAGGFGEADQARLAELAESAASRGNRVVVSNHDTPVTRSLYRRARKFRVPVRRSISCNGGKRQKVNEVIAVFTEKSVQRGRARGGG